MKSRRSRINDIVLSPALTRAALRRLARSKRVGAKGILMDFGYGAPVGHAYERWLLRRFAHRLLQHETRFGRHAPRAPVARWLKDHRALLGLGRSLPDVIKADDNGRVDRATWRALAPAFERLGDIGAAPAPSSLEKRVCAFGETLALGATDMQLFGALARTVLSQPLRELIQRLEGSEDGGWFEEQTSLGALSIMLAAPQSRLRALVAEDAPLARYGFVHDRRHGEIGLTRRALSILRLPANDSATLRRRLLGPCITTSLGFEDFAHIEGHDIAAAVLSGALAKRARGVNILCYGAHGAGKSEFARALGAHLGAQAVFAGETGGRGADDEPSRYERLGAVALSRLLARQIGRAFVVVDEADDIFVGVDSSIGSSRRGSKAFANRLVETSDAPTIWIVNDQDTLGRAILRRMTYVLRFPTPSRTVRASIVERIAVKRRVRLDAAQLQALASLDATPAVLSHALRTAELAKLDGDGALKCARAALRALDGVAPTSAPQPISFDALMLRADTDLVALRERVMGAQTRALSFCFHGLPGAGKSAYARHLAEALELDVLEKRASDLLSKWLGETEKAIRAAFEEAADLQAFLIFDEADSLLAARAGAERSWEVTQVNEMLVCMERHPLPFTCTTNAFRALDAASLRRFLFKVGFLPMAPAQIECAFQRAFGAAAPRQLLSVGNLTPGDFAIVARKASVMGDVEPAILARWLHEEAIAKPEGEKRRIGF